MFRFSSVSGISVSSSSGLLRTSSTFSTSRASWSLWKVRRCPCWSCRGKEIPATAIFPIDQSSNFVDVPLLSLSHCFLSCLVNSVVSSDLPPRVPSVLISSTHAFNTGKMIILFTGFQIIKHFFIPFFKMIATPLVMM